MVMGYKFKDSVLACAINHTLTQVQYVFKWENAYPNSFGGYREMLR